MIVRGRLTIATKHHGNAVNIIGSVNQINRKLRILVM